MAIKEVELKEDQFENKNLTEEVRNGEEHEFEGVLSKKISGYKFKIFKTGEPTLEGTISRQDMETIHSLYTTRGRNLTQKEVHSNFPQYSFEDFKKIIRAFNIKKCSNPLAPHQLEEMTSEECINYSLRLKENQVSRKVEAEASKFHEKRNEELVKENFFLKNRELNLQEIFKDITFPEVHPREVPTYEGVNDFYVYLSDLHIGADVDSEGIYENEYNLEEVKRRLEKVYNKILNTPGIKNLVILGLGDMVDGFNKQTTRKGSTHILPQNLTNKGQARGYVDIMIWFFDKIYSNCSYEKLHFYSVGHSNHGGDFEYSLNYPLMFILEDRYNVNTYLATKAIDHFELNGQVIIFGHGKDIEDQIRNLPLTVNDRLEAYFSQYIMRNKLLGKNILLVKGDLHQSATTYGKSFCYKSVSSLFGSSNWIHANFGYTPWGCDYSVFLNTGERLDGVIKE